MVFRQLSLKAIKIILKKSDFYCELLQKLLILLSILLQVMRERMRKQVFMLFFLLLGWLDVNAQFDAERSQYMNNQVAINPAAVASNDMFNLMGTYRMQWAGFSDAPVDMFFSANTPLTIAGTKHGVGLSFMSDEAGLFTNQSVLFQYSYKMKVFRGVMSLGIGLGGVNQTFDGASADVTGNGGSLAEDDGYHTDSDPLVDKSEMNDLAFDVSFGAYYSEDDFYVGLSVAHLNRPSFEMTETTESYLPRIFYLVGGYNIRTSNPLLVLKPSALIKTEFSSFQMDASFLMEYNKKFAGGLSYRWGGAFVFMAEYNLISGLALGYSYDLPTSKMVVSGGSHEISLRYSFRPEFAKKNKYKSERIL